MTVSVIIPTFHEQSQIADTIANIRSLGESEIIVVDGRSQDDTLHQARCADRVLSSQPGRARQMNLGATHASGDVYVFLHADCRLEMGALQRVRKVLTCPDIVAGCFSMCVQKSGTAYRMIDAWAGFRARVLGSMYGDQGLFLRKRTFEALGGFPKVPFLEDVLISQMLCNLGRIVVIPERIYVSPRRWEKTGIIRQTIRNWTLVALARCGVSPQRLAKHYPNIR